ncbi:glucose 1-dehydrogenase [Streptomyces mayteni]
MATSEAERRRVTVVTGGSRGIGAAVAVRLAADGHDVAIGFARDEAAAGEVADRVRAAGRRAVAVRADVSVERDVAALFDAAVGELGRVTGLVNNAAVSGPLGRFDETPPEVMRRVVDVNMVGAMLCARRAAREMSRRHGGAGGAIVNISSGAATLGSPGEYVHYAASKAAVDTLTLGLAKELGPEGVRVNSVQPGVVDTDIHTAMGEPGRAERIGRATPLGRAGHPEEIAAAVAWLLSPEASYTTGAILRVAGGR